MADIAQMQADIVHIQQNMQNALDRSAAAEAKGDTKYAAIWKQSAERYKALIVIKENLIDSKERLEAIKNRSKITLTPQTVEEEDPNKKTRRPKINPDVPDAPSKPSGSTQPPTPITPPPPPPVKTAPLDTILFDEEAVQIEVMTDLIFENIGGQELLNIARNDTINGQKIIYQPIKNLTTIQQKYNPNNIVSLQQTFDKYFQGFSIQLDEKIPNVGNGPNGETVYVDPETGDLVIELVNIYQGEQVESQISISGTIYEADI